MTENLNKEKEPEVYNDVIKIEQAKPHEINKLWQPKHSKNTNDLDDYLNSILGDDD